MNRVILLAFTTAALGLSLDQNDLFDGSTIHEIRLTIHPTDWQNLRNNYLENNYYPAVLSWRGMEVYEVAIRSRGLGSRSQEKPGLRVDFNRFSDGQEFLGLKSLVLDNMAQDRSLMAERISMEIFRRMGLPAPRVAHTRLYINDAYWGVYTIVEPIDKPFLKRNLGDDGGYLYDYEWVFDYWFDYLGPEPGHYTPAPFEPQTNESDPQPGPLVEMIRVINESSDEEFGTAISTYLDLRRVATYLAVETFIGEVDGLAGDWGVNNLYLYRYQGRNTFEFLPWDKDVALQGPSAARSIWANFDRNVLVRRMMAIPEIRNHYLSALNQCMEIAGGPGGWLEQEISRVYNQIRVAALDDPRKPQTNAEFEDAVAGVGSFASERPSAVSAQIAENAASAAVAAPSQR